jgi:hypothetical protein
MSGNVLVDVAIGLATVYLLGSLLCTIVQEWIARLCELRAHNLHAAVAFLIHGKSDPDDKEKALAKDLLEHPLVRLSASYVPANGTAPSYLAPRNFTLALLDRAGITYGADGRLDPAAVAARLTAKNPDGSHVVALPEALRSGLLAVVNGAARDANALLAEMDAWFNASMARASGWYTRLVQKYLLVIGIALAVLFGADSIGMAHKLATDRQLRDHWVAVGAAMAPAGPEGADFARQKALADAALLKLALGQVPQNPATPEEKALAHMAARIQSLGALPFGPGDWFTLHRRDFVQSAHWPVLAWIALFVVKLAGCAITGLALALGAPFWFGLLQQLNAIRASGPKPPAPSA